MGDIVDIGQSWGDQHVVLILCWEAGVRLQDDLLRVELFEVLFRYLKFLYVVFWLFVSLTCLVTLGLFHCRFLRLFFFLQFFILGFETFLQFSELLLWQPHPLSFRQRLRIFSILVFLFFIFSSFLHFFLRFCYLYGLFFLCYFLHVQKLFKSIIYAINI